MKTATNPTTSNRVDTASIPFQFSCDVADRATVIYSNGVLVGWTVLAVGREWLTLWSVDGGRNAKLFGGYNYTRKGAVDCMFEFRDIYAPNN